MNKGNEHVENRTAINYDFTDGDNTAKCVHFAYVQSECAHAILLIRASNISAQQSSFIRTTTLYCVPLRCDN